MSDASFSSSSDLLLALIDGHHGLYSPGARWPASRNDHYCDQAVCHHAVIDLYPPIETSDSEDDANSQINYTASRSSRSEDVYLLEDGCRALLSVDESGSSACQFLHSDQDQPCDKHRNPTSNDTSRMPTHEQQEILHTYLSQLITSHAHLLRELNNLTTNTSESLFSLDENSTALKSAIIALTTQHAHLARKHDTLLDILTHLCDALNMQAHTLADLEAAKPHENTPPRTTNPAHDAKSPEFRFYSPSTAIQVQGDETVSPLSPPLTPPISPEVAQLKRPRLVLRLPPRPPSAEEEKRNARGSSGGMDDVGVVEKAGCGKLGKTKSKKKKGMRGGSGVGKRKTNDGCEGRGKKKRRGESVV